MTLSWRDIAGWSADIETFYDHIARTCEPEATLVEVGVWCGRSVIGLAQMLKDYRKPFVTVYAVDAFKNTEGLTEDMRTFIASQGGSIRPIFEQNCRLAHVDDQVRTLEGDSAECASHFIDGELDMVFIDADHRFEYVARDIKSWQPKLRRGGVLAGHDYADESVARAVQELLPGAAVQGLVWLKLKE
jgi:predicted O-methyltransferase YrrM